MDMRDRRIVYELSKNARIPTNQLAKKIRLSAQATAARIEKLFRDKVVFGTYAFVDYSAIGFFANRLYFRFYNTTPEKEDEIIEWVVGQKQASAAGRCSGEVDVVVLSFTPGALDFYEFVCELKSRYKKHITSVQTFQYIRTHQFQRSYLVGKEDVTYYSTGSFTKVKVDDLDRDILDILSSNARMSLVEMSTKLGSSVKTVGNRLRRLEKKGVIKGYSMSLDLEKFGYEYYKVGIVLDKVVSQSTLLTLAASIPNTIYVDETVSKFDFEINFEVQDRPELDRILQGLKKELGGFRCTEIFRAEEWHKLQVISM